MKTRSIPMLLVLMGLPCAIGFFGGFYLWHKIDISRINSFDPCVAHGFPIMESYPEQCATPDGKTFTRHIPTTKITIRGTVECLPHKNSEGPQTMECAFGLLSDDGKHYALKDPLMQYMTSIPVGDKVEIDGIFAEGTSDTYSSVGILEIEKLSEL